MAVKMATPSRHPKTGVYWFRKRVPAAVRAKVGKDAVTRSLRTKDIKEAKARFLEVAAEFEREWAAMQADSPPLTHKQLHALAGEFYRWMVARHEENPGSAARWQGEVDRDVAYNWRRMPGAKFSHYGGEVQKFLKERHMALGGDDAYRLTCAAITAGKQAKETLARMAGGHYENADPVARGFPKWEPPQESARPPSAKSLTLAEHFDKFAKESKLASGTIKRWKPLLEKLAVHIGSEDLSKATPDKLVDWKDALLEAGIQQVTIKDGHFAAARCFFNWAVSNKKIEKNPLDGITVKGVDKEDKLRSRSLTDEEAHLILSEALRKPDSRASQELKDAKRWIPWLLAYGGARVNELTQLRAEDVFSRRIGEEEVWIVRITPEAGRVKNRQARDVPLHPHIVEQGFVEFVKRKGSGPLFYDPKRRRDGTDQNPQNRKIGDKLAEWVRGIGVTGVPPNHGWRHRFMDVAMKVRMDPRIRDVIQGHAPRTVGENYGEVPIEAKWGEILRLPRYEVAEPVGPRPVGEKAKEASRKRMATAKRAKERLATAAE